MSILIKNGLIYNGKGQPPFKSDILIKEKFIAGIGKFSRDRAETIIDAEESLVLPGFIDINSSVDHYLSIFHQPHQERLLKQGITTVIGGNCGSSLAPALSGSLRSIRKWGLEEESKFNVDWHSFKDFLDAIKTKKLMTNFGSLVGHSTVRQEFVDQRNNDLKKDGLEPMKKVLRESLQEGALGVSVGTAYKHPGGIPLKELIEVAQETKKNNKVFAIHLQDPNTLDGIEKSAEEIMTIIKETGVNAEINHLQPISCATKNYQKIKEVFEEESLKNRINFDCYPYDVTAVPIYKLLPEEMQHENQEKMIDLLKESRVEKQIINELKSITAKQITMARLPTSLSFAEGKTVKEFADDLDIGEPEALIKLMKLSSLRAVLIYHNVNSDTLQEFMTSSISIIASNGIHFLDKEFQPFLEFIKWSSEKTTSPLERSITKITSLPASKYGIERRGVIQENNYADIVVLKHLSVSDVIINGKAAVIEGKTQKIKSGELIKN